MDFLTPGNSEYIESVYDQFLKDPSSVEAHWLDFFQNLAIERIDGAKSKGPRRAEPAKPKPGDSISDTVEYVIHCYREYGHLAAQLDPLKNGRPGHPLLTLPELGINPQDLTNIVDTGDFAAPQKMALGEFINRLNATYCGTFAVEYMYIEDKEQRQWLQKRIESSLGRPNLNPEQQLGVLRGLFHAEMFENFLQTKYLGQKRFSCEGCDAMIPLLNAVIEHGGLNGAEDFVIGMAHRGRLNVLAHVLRKPYELIFSEFEGSHPGQDNVGEGDVKYHKGYSNDLPVSSGVNVHLSLASNPSHLELIDPVVEGQVYVKQQYKKDAGKTRVVPILVHGEAAFTGQGIVTETLNLSQLPHYRTGGTIHLIVNNQVGFTATAAQTRFTPYPTDVAKGIQAPIFHVNADDPEAVVFAAQLAIQFRQQFKKDVLIDLWGYRKHGHNETDDPTFTQPLMYEKISQHPAVTAQYTAKLIGEKRATQEQIDQVKKEILTGMEEAHKRVKEQKWERKAVPFSDVWKDFTRASDKASVDTQVPDKTIRQIAESVANIPSTFNVHPKLQKLMKSRSEMAEGKRKTDWGCAEMWAFGSLLLGGVPIRLAGQDVERGTFSHRHALLHDIKTGDHYVPLTHLAKDQGSFTVVNTMLSELAVVGFEYGFASADPRNLVLWEGQFGDFVNMAQPIIDQFIVASEYKWNRMNGLVMLLPHGYEGQGPEHSSGRLERFLQLCAEENIQVCVPSLPSQYFHLLRRQMLRRFRKPLVLFMPKSLLRDEEAGSLLEEFTKGGFRPLITDSAVPDRNAVKRLLFCTGKVAFTLDKARKKEALGNVAIERIEQLYPFPEEEVASRIRQYPNLTDVIWVQEEPKNMGSWTFIDPRVRKVLPGHLPLSYCGRAESASPATGSLLKHQAEERAFVEKAIKGEVREKVLSQSREQS